MSYDIKDFLKKFFSSRLFVLAAVFIVFFGIILARIFTLQVVNGKSYQENFSLKIQMKQPINAARGNIYDKNGKLLAYNELAYSISINQSSAVTAASSKNQLQYGKTNRPCGHRSRPCSCCAGRKNGRLYHESGRHRQYAL